MSNPAFAAILSSPFSGCAGAVVDESEIPLARELSSLAPGQVGVIESVDTASAAACRMLDLGFVPGSQVRVVRRAPLGDPTEYEIRGTRLCLRSSESSRILVRRIAAL